MKKAVYGVLMVVAALLLFRYATFPPQDSAQAQQVSPPDSFSQGAKQGLIAFSTAVDDQYQQVTVLDPRAKVISVYHISLETGDVKLCCVREIEWDLQMMYFNGEAPLPPKIKEMLESNRRSSGGMRPAPSLSDRTPSGTNRSHPYP